MQEVGFLRKLKLGRSSIHGWGVFACESIPASTIIEVSPGVLISQEVIGACYYILMANGMKPDELILDQYGLGWDSERVLIPLGWVGLYNHSEKPNAEFVKDEENSLIAIRTLQEIFPGEEVTVHYGDQWWLRKNYLQKA